MFITGISDEAGSLIDTQIRATKELGWNTIEARTVEVPGFEKANIHDLPEPAFDIVADKLNAADVSVYCFGSTIGNFNHTEFPRFFRALSAAMGPNDFLLLGADRVKPVKMLEDAYDDRQGVTAEFILNVFDNINRLLQSNFERAQMRYHARFNPEWRQIEMYAIATEVQEIIFPSAKTSFHWRKDERILVEISRKFDPLRLQEQMRFFGFLPLLLRNILPGRLVQRLSLLGADPLDIHNLFETACRNLLGRLKALLE